MRFASVVLFSLNACTTLSGQAQSDFAHRYTCPPEQVTVVRVAPFPFVPDAPPRPTPPPEVAADPARLRYWNEQQDTAAREAVRSQKFEGAAYVASGCGHKQRLHCIRPTGSDNEGHTVIYAPQCSEEISPMINVAGLDTYLVYGLSLQDRLLPDLVTAQCTAFSVWGTAQTAGLARDDVFVAIDGQGVANSGQAAAIIRRATPSPHAVRVLRGKDTLDLSLPPPPP